jgi:hypothetical protein
MIGGLIGLFIHYLRFGPKDREDQDIREQIATAQEKAVKQAKLGRAVEPNEKERL